MLILSVLDFSAKYTRKSHQHLIDFGEHESLGHHSDDKGHLSIQTIFSISSDIAMRGKGSAQSMPDSWWLLMSACSILGVATWYLRNFTDRDELMRLCAFTGIACMLSLLGWTLTMDI